MLQRWLTPANRSDETAAAKTLICMRPRVVQEKVFADQLLRGIFLRARSSHAVLCSKIFLAWPEVSDKPLWVGKPVSMLIQEMGGSS